MPYSLTPMQADVLRGFADMALALGRPPSVRELAHELDLMPSDVIRCYGGLEERGWIRREPGVAGGVTVLHPPPSWPPETPVEVTPAGLAALSSARSAGQGVRS